MRLAAQLVSQVPGRGVTSSNRARAGRGARRLGEGAVDVGADLGGEALLALRVPEAARLEVRRMRATGSDPVLAVAPGHHGLDERAALPRGRAGARLAHDAETATTSPPSTRTPAQAVGDALMAKPALAVCRDAGVLVAQPLLRQNGDDRARA